jgi:hypothetical protein
MSKPCFMDAIFKSLLNELDRLAEPNSENFKELEDRLCFMSKSHLIFVKGFSLGLQNELEKEATCYAQYEEAAFTEQVSARKMQQSAEARVADDITAVEEKGDEDEDDEKGQDDEDEDEDDEDEDDEDEDEDDEKGQDDDEHGKVPKRKRTSNETVPATKPFRHTRAPATRTSKRRSGNQRTLACDEPRVSPESSGDIHSQHGYFASLINQFSRVLGRHTFSTWLLCFFN